MNFFSLKEKIVIKNQIIKITFENIGNKALIFYLQNDEVIFAIDNIYKKIKNDDKKNIHLFTMKSKGENLCTYLHNEKKQTFTKFFNNGKKYVVTDISLLTANI